MDCIKDIAERRNSHTAPRAVGSGQSSSERSSEAAEPPVTAHARMKPQVKEGGEGTLRLRSCGHPRPSRRMAQRRGSNTAESSCDDDSNDYCSDDEGPCLECLRRNDFDLKKEEGKHRPTLAVEEGEGSLPNLWASNEDNDKEEEEGLVGEGGGRASNKGGGDFVPSLAWSSNSSHGSAGPLDDNEVCGGGTDDDDIPKGAFCDMLGEAQHYLALSMFVYMYAQLREMAVLGYTEVDFREIDCNSYKPWTKTDEPVKEKVRSESWVAGLTSDNNPSLPPELHSLPPQKTSMAAKCRPSKAVRRGTSDWSVASDKSTQSTRSSRSLSSHSFSSRVSSSRRGRRRNGSSSNSKETDQYPTYLLNTKPASSIIRVVLTELEREKYAERRVDELRQSGWRGSSFNDIGFSCQHDISMIKEFRKWVDDSKAEQLDDAAEQVILELRKKVAASRWRRSISAIRTTVRLRKSIALVAAKNAADDSGSDQDIKKSIALVAAYDSGNDEVVPAEARSEGIEQIEPTELGRPVSSGSSGSKRSPLRRSPISESLSCRRSDFARTSSVRRGELGWLTLEKRLIEDHFGVATAHHEAEKDLSDEVEPNFTAAAMESKELTDMAVDRSLVESVLDQRLHTYFKKRSALSRMIESGIEVAYFGDRHRNEAIYCVCVCHETKTVTVVFRGSVTAHNWKHNLKIVMSEHPNPVSDEEYTGRAETVRLHTGFGLYLLRQRRDTGRSKYDEIVEKVHSIGMDLAPDGKYRLTVAGHSLGGALATIFSFYAAADERFTRAEPVRTFTFAAPRVGDTTFAAAYARLERTRRVLHARLSNTRDVVPLFPMFSMHGMKFGPTYKHVGLQVRLHETNLLGKWRMKNALDVTHPAQEGWRNKFWMAWKNNLLSNINTLGGFRKSHILSTHQKRLNFTRQYRVGLGQSEHFADRRRKHLKSLEEYYPIKMFGHASTPPSLDVQIGGRNRRVITFTSLLSGLGVLSLLFAKTNFPSTCQPLADGPRNDRGVPALDNVQFFNQSLPVVQEEFRDLSMNIAQLEVLQQGNAVLTDITTDNLYVFKWENQTCAANAAADVFTEWGAPIDASENAPPPVLTELWGLTFKPAFLRPAENQLVEESTSISPQLLELANLRSCEVVAEKTQQVWNALHCFRAFEGKVLVERKMQVLETGNRISL